MWAFMKALSWDALSTDLIKVGVPAKGEGQPQRFIPVFDLKKDALKFAGVDKHLVAELQIIKEVEKE